jgi:hypothetical protein
MEMLCSAPICSQHSIEVPLAIVTMAALGLTSLPPAYG